MRAGQILTVNPSAAAIPVRTGRATSRIARTANRVGTTSNRTTMIGPTTTPASAQSHGPRHERAGAATVRQQEHRHDQRIDEEDAEGEGPAVVDGHGPGGDEERRDAGRVLPRGVARREGALAEGAEPALVDDEVIEHPRREIDRYHCYDPGREPGERESRVHGPGVVVGSRQWGIHLMGFRVGCGEHSHGGSGSRRPRAFPDDGCSRWIPCRSTQIGASAGRVT